MVAFYTVADLPIGQGRAATLPNLATKISYTLSFPPKELKIHAGSHRQCGNGVLLFRGRRRQSIHSQVFFRSEHVCLVGPDA
jgi:hypothetical protein